MAFEADFWEETERRKFITEGWTRVLLLSCMRIDRWEQTQLLI